MLGKTLQERLNAVRPIDSKPGTLYLLADAYSRIYKSWTAVIRYAWDGHIDAIIELARQADAMKHHPEQENWARTHLLDILRTLNPQIQINEKDSYIYPTIRTIFPHETELCHTTAAFLIQPLHQQAVLRLLATLLGSLGGDDVKYGEIAILNDLKGRINPSHAMVALATLKAIFKNNMPRIFHDQKRTSMFIGAFENEVNKFMDQLWHGSIDWGSLPESINQTLFNQLDRALTFNILTDVAKQIMPRLEQQRRTSREKVAATPSPPARERPPEDAAAATRPSTAEAIGHARGYGGLPKEGEAEDATPEEEVPPPRREVPPVGGRGH